MNWGQDWLWTPAFHWPHSTSAVGACHPHSPYDKGPNHPDLTFADCGYTMIKFKGGSKWTRVRNGLGKVAPGGGVEVAD